MNKYNVWISSDLNAISNNLNWKLVGNASGSEELLLPESYSEICLTAYMNGQVLLFATLPRGIIQDNPTSYISGGSFPDHKYGILIKLSKTSAKIEQAYIDDIDQINLSGMAAYYR